MLAGRLAKASRRRRRGVVGSRVEDSEADATVIGEKATYKARGREHVIESSGVLFDRVAGLGQDQREKQDTAPPTHSYQT